MKGHGILWLAATLLAGTAAAAPLTISNRNASITVDPDTVFGLSSYTLNGTEQIFEQWFWFRLPADTFEHPLNTLPLTSADATGNQIQLSFAGATLAVNLGYRLTGGAPGTKVADLQEQVTLHNLGGADLPVTWFMEADFDLNGFGGQDLIVGDANGMVQTDGTTTVKVQSSRTPDAFQVAAFPELFLSLSDLSITRLDNTGSPFGPGDGTFAYQWNLLIPADDSITFSIDKAFIPEPDTLALCLVGLGVLPALRLRHEYL
jgi:hypothetical protein